MGRLHRIGYAEWCGVVSRIERPNRTNKEEEKIPHQTQSRARKTPQEILNAAVGSAL
jgi:hypothetical protein